MSSEHDNNMEESQRVITSDPQTWRQFWLQAKARSPANRRERRRQSAELDSWNSRASGYAEHSETRASRARRGEILSWLTGAGVFREHSRVLDIGAGPGNYAIPISGKVEQVTAVEPARGMVDILQRRLASEGIGNIRVVPKTWEQIDLERQGWRGAFDLVFASMSPGVSNPDMLEKMIAASRRFCYLSGWSGDRWGRWGLAQAELWPLIFGERLGDYPGDILYAFGMLYALGFRPELRFVQPRVHLEMEQQRAVEELAAHFSRYLEVDAEVRRRIRSYVQEYSRAGTFEQEYTTCQGFMLWAVENNCD